MLADPSICTHTFQIYECRQFSKEDRLLEADYTVSCNTGLHRGFYVLGFFLVVFVAVGVPLFLLVYLYRRTNTGTESDFKRDFEIATAVLAELKKKGNSIGDDDGGEDVEAKCASGKHGHTFECIGCLAHRSEAQFSAEQMKHTKLNGVPLRCKICVATDSMSSSLEMKHVQRLLRDLKLADFNSLIKIYKPEWFLWETLDMGRKLVLGANATQKSRC